MIGIFDSGVGGLTVFKAVEAALPASSFIYLGDTARVPYGTRSPATVVRYAEEAARFLRGHDIELLIVACNTASSVALDAMRREADVPVIGVIEPGAGQAAAASRSGRIGVIGTRATIKSDAYTRAIAARRPDAQVFSWPCPLFVPLAEEGWVENEVAEATAHRYLDPLKDEGVDTLVLGCTHYPLLKEVIGRVMGPEVTLVDSADAVAETVRRQRDGGEGQAGPRRFFVTDAPEAFGAVAERFLGRTLDNLETTELGVRSNP